MGDALSGYTAKILAEALNEQLQGKHLSKVQQVGENTFKLSFSSPKKELIIEPGRRMHLTEYAVEVPEKASQVSMILRKFISGKRVKRVYQHDEDRIIVIEFENFKLITEFFSHGNFVLVDNDSVILFTFLKESWKDRDLRKEAVFRFPSNIRKEMKKDYSPVSEEAVKEKGVNAALDAYYSQEKKENPKLQKLRNRLAIQKKTMKEYELLAEQEREKGDLIYSNYQKVDEALRLSRDEIALKKAGVFRKGRKLVVDLN